MESETATTNKKKYVPNSPSANEMVYELWWNFLALSPKYEKFCEIMRTITDTTTEDFYRQFDEAYKTKYPESTQLFDSDYYDNNLTNWEFMGDVHKNEFQDWWKNFKVIKKIYSIINLKEPDAKNKFPIYKFMLNAHHKKSKTPLAPDEAIRYFTASKEYIFLAIPVADDLKTTTIREIITKMRKKAKKESPNYKNKLNLCRFRIPYGTIRYDELNNYYTVYKADKETSNRNAAKKKAGIEDASVFTKHLRRASVIINNVEEGIFPGKEYWRE